MVCRASSSRYAYSITEKKIIGDVVLQKNGSYEGSDRNAGSTVTRPTVSVLAVALILCGSISLAGCCSTCNGQSRSDYAQTDESMLSSDGPVLCRMPERAQAIDYDPWESFNEQAFYFNFNVLDRYGLKPAAEVWSRALPEDVREGLANAFDNLGMPRRFVNNVLQARLPRAADEFARFLANTTLGGAGFVDVAARLGLQEHDADTGQTLGVYGIDPGPYLVLPLLPPLTVRDAVGYAADSLMDPLSYFVTPFFADVGRSAAKIINERAANMTEYDEVADTSLDLYAAVRNGFLQRREQSVDDAIRDRNRLWESVFNRYDPNHAPLQPRREGHPCKTSVFVSLREN